MSPCISSIVVNALARNNYKRSFQNYNHYRILYVVLIFFHLIFLICAEERDIYTVTTVLSSTANLDLNR